MSEEKYIFAKKLEKEPSEEDKERNDIIQDENTGQSYQMMYIDKVTTTVERLRGKIPGCVILVTENIVKPNGSSGYKITRVIE